MKRLYRSRRSLSLSAALTGSVLLLSMSCVNSAYDFDKGVDLEMNVGGSLTMPVGSTKPITLGDMLDAEDIEMLELLENGDYKISMSDQMVIEMDPIADSENVTIAAQSDSREVSVDFESMELSSINFELDPYHVDVTNDDLTAVDMDSSDSAIDAQFTVGTSLGSELEGRSVEGVEVDKEVEIVVENPNYSISMAGDIEVPDHIEKVTYLKIDSEASITIDLEELYSVMKPESFYFELPYIELIFPEGFVLDGGSNILRKENLTTTGSSMEITFMVDEYNKDIVRLWSGTLEGISGEIVCNMPTYAHIKGITNGATIESSSITVDVFSEAKLQDATIVVSNLLVEIGGDEELSDIIEIETPDFVKRVNSVTTDSSYDDVYIAITPLQILEGLECSGDDIKIGFPRSKFLLNANEENNYEYDDQNSYLSIPLSNVVGGEGYSSKVELKTLTINGDVVAGEGDASSYVEFDPSITLMGATVSLSGTVQLSDYNDYVELSHSVTTTIHSEELIVEDADIIFDDYLSELELSTTSISESISLPDEIVKIDSMMFHNRVFISINVEVDIEGTDATLSFNDYEITFPRFIKFDSSVAVDEDNVLVLNDDFVTNQATRSYSTELEIVALDFTDPAYASLIGGEKGNKSLTIDEIVSFEGGVKIASAQMNSGEFNEEIVAQIGFEISEMDIAKVYGVLNPEIPTKQSDIDLNSLSEALDGGDLSIVLSDPLIVVEASNSLSIPIAISTLEIIPTKEGESLTTLSLSEAIDIDAAVEGVEQITTIYITANESYSPTKSDATVVVMPELKNILENMPDNITLIYGAEAKVIEGENHMIDLYESYSFVVDYSLDVPLRIDELSLDYTTTVDGLQSSLESVISYITTLELEFEATNTLPINLSILSITPLDTNGEILEALGSILEQGENVIVANGDSTIKLSLCDNDSGELELLDGLDISIAANVDYTEGGVALNAEQYIQFNIAARLPDGVTFDPTDL